MTDLDRVLDAVGLEYGCSRQALLSQTRGLKGTAWARQVAMWLMWRLSAQPTYTHVGAAFSRDRTTVRHAVQKVVKAGDPRALELEKQLVSPATTL